jgi:hypothetical protein
MESTAASVGQRDRQEASSRRDFEDFTEDVRLWFEPFGYLRRSASIIGDSAVSR